MRQAEAKSLYAKITEIKAISNEINGRIEQLSRRMEKNAELTRQAIDHLYKARAYSAFIDSGGGKAHFDRMWRDVLKQTVSKR